MRAMVFTRTGVVEMAEVERPVPAVGEVLIDVAAAGICGSELHGIAHPGFRQPPLIMGHEFAGTTTDGRRVTVNPIVSCGRCDLCLSEADHLCRQRSIIGIHRAGAFAEQLVVPSQALYELPDAVTWEMAAMIEPLANALHAWRLASAPPSGRVAIIGAGTIGLVSLLVARCHRADVTVVDLAEDRLDVAKRLGAAVTATELEGEYDLVIDAVGAPTTRSIAVDRLRPGGVTVWLGLLSPDAGFDATDLIRQEKRIVGSFAYTGRDFVDAIDLVPTVDLSWSTSFPLGEGATVFTELMHGRSDIVKALLRP